MQSQICLCSRPLTRGRSKGCPIHDKGLEDSGLGLERPDKQSTPVIE